MAPKKKPAGKKVWLLPPQTCAPDSAGHLLISALGCLLQEKKKEGVPAGDIEGASVDELNQKIGTLEKEKNKEEEYRNYMQLERVSNYALTVTVSALLMLIAMMVATSWNHATPCISLAHGTQLAWNDSVTVTKVALRGQDALH